MKRTVIVNFNDMCHTYNHPSKICSSPINHIDGKMSYNTMASCSDVPFLNQEFSLLPECIQAIHSVWDRFEFFFLADGSIEELIFKNQILKEAFGDLYDEQQLIRCPDKRLLHGFCMIDNDLESHEQGTANHHIIYAQPWNKQFDSTQDCIRTNNWILIQEILEVLANEY